MAEDRIQRDSLHNAMLEDRSVKTADLAWVPFCEGISFKLLRVSPETGAWTVLFHADAGAGFDRHKHLGPAEYFMISGRMEIRGGEEAGGTTAVAGDYGYEANGMLHDWTNFPEESVFYFTNIGPLGFLDDDDNVVGVLDWQGVVAMSSAPAAQAVSA
ncbi:2,4'-dihydroxyacetophenone dioxygenase family protein [Pseudonocardia acidicola]|uniref:Acetylacetone-cleaving protein n=1 Tax=Pseudonocardia acidicola TaxID=2724939 RepID=A0ABX1SFR3_9PSEU|nr:2,4'-dihydroxyacetophenone dioxygenase family protein [Pseudonocardia acidicola]NMI00389.1 acetylacetone-cleaving protein [Pseudonocardia acidicola]